jgi:hypothetical protein
MTRVRFRRARAGPISVAYRRPVILAEIGNRLVIRNQPTGEPHHLNVAARLTLKPAARLNPIGITVNGELQQHRRMVRRPAGGLGINPAKPKPGQIEPPEWSLHPRLRGSLLGSAATF